MANLRNLDLSQTELDEIYRLIKPSPVDFSGNLDLDKLTQLLILCYRNNIDLFITLVKLRGKFKGDIIKKHFFNSYCMKNLIESIDRDLEIPILIEAIGEEVLKNLNSTTKIIKIESAALPRNIALESYAKYLAQSDRKSELIALCKKAKNLGWRGDWDKYSKLNAVIIQSNKEKYNLIREQGDTAERIVLEWLESHGYNVVLFGKSRTKNPLLSKVPILPDIMVGTSIISHGNAITDLECSNSELVKSGHLPLPKAFDFDAHELNRLSKVCGKLFPCALYRSDASKAPCNGITPIFNENKSGSLRLDVLSEFKPCELQINVCQHRIGEIAAITDEGLNAKNKFLRDNIRIGIYIKKFQIYINYYNQNFSENRKKYKFNSHPGRYDFVAYKDGHITAVEVKSGGSTLDYWQKIRIGSLIKMGHKAIILRVVKSTNGTLQVLLEKPDINVDLPSEEEIQKVLDFIHPSEMVLSENKGNTPIRSRPIDQ